MEPLNKYHFSCLYYHKNSRLTYYCGNLTCPFPHPPEPVKLTEELVAWRAWRSAYPGEWEGNVDYAVLRSVFYPNRWPGGEAFQAEVPQFTNTKGIYAMKQPDEVIKHVATYPHLVYGKVSLWGRVVESQFGYRAECAYPHTLYVRDPFLRRKLHEHYGCEVKPVPVEYFSNPYLRGVFNE